MDDQVLKDALGADAGLERGVFAAVAGLFRTFVGERAS